MAYEYYFVVKRFPRWETVHLKNEIEEYKQNRDNTPEMKVKPNTTLLLLILQTGSIRDPDIRFKLRKLLFDYNIIYLKFFSVGFYMLKNNKKLYVTF